MTDDTKAIEELREAMDAVGTFSDGELWAFVTDIQNEDAEACDFARACRTGVPALFRALEDAKSFAAQRRDQADLDRVQAEDRAEMLRLSAAAESACRERDEALEKVAWYVRDKADGDCSLDLANANAKRFREDRDEARAEVATLRERLRKAEALCYEESDRQDTEARRSHLRQSAMLHEERASEASFLGDEIRALSALDGEEKP